MRAHRCLRRLLPLLVGGVLFLSSAPVGAITLPFCPLDTIPLGPAMRWHSAITFRHVFRDPQASPTWAVLLQIWNVDENPQTCGIAWDFCRWSGEIPGTAVKTHVCIHTPPAPTGNTVMFLRGEQSPGNHCAFRARVCQLLEGHWFSMSDSMVDTSFPPPDH